MAELGFLMKVCCSRGNFLTSLSVVRTLELRIWACQGLVGMRGPQKFSLHRAYGSEPGWVEVPGKAKPCGLLFNRSSLACLKIAPSCTSSFRSSFPPNNVTVSRKNHGIHSSLGPSTEVVRLSCTLLIRISSNLQSSMLPVWILRSFWRMTRKATGKNRWGPPTGPLVAC